MVNFKKLVTPLSFKLETIIWSHDTGYWIPCFDRCQLSKTWMSNINIKDVGCEYCHHVLGEIIFHRWAEVPAIHAATHVDHEKCMVFYLYAHMWFSSYCYSSQLGSSLGNQTSATRTYQRHVLI